MPRPDSSGSEPEPVASTVPPDHQRESIVYIGDSDAIVRERRHQREQQHEASREPDSRRSINFSVTFIAIPYALLEKGPRMTNTAGISGDRICSFIERVERIDEEIKALNEGKKEVFAEAKGEGFDVKVLREILRLRKQDMDERDEQESLLDLYLRAMEHAGSSQAEAA